MIMTGISAWNIFKLRPFDTYYADGDTVFGSNNWWKYANYGLQYGSLGFGGFATLSTLLSLFGFGI